MNIFHRMWHWFVTDDMRLRRWFRGFLSWLVTTSIQVTAVGPEAVMTWSVKRWIVGFLISGLAGVVGLINLGQMNPAPVVADKGDKGG